MELTVVSRSLHSHGFQSLRRCHRLFNKRIPKVIGYWKYSYSHPLVVVMIMMVILHLPGTIQTLCKLVIVEVGLLNDGNSRVIESF